MTPRTTLDSKEIDELYGLEPVLEFEETAAAGAAQLVRVQCPYCGEPFDTVVDASAGSFQYIEDCQVCCQPIELAGTVDEDGVLGEVTASRA